MPVAKTGVGSEADPAMPPCEEGRRGTPPVPRGPCHDRQGLTKTGGQASRPSRRRARANGGPSFRQAEGAGCPSRNGPGSLCVEPLTWLAVRTSAHFGRFRSEKQGSNLQQSDLQSDALPIEQFSRDVWMSRWHLPRFQALAYGDRQRRPHRRGDHPLPLGPARWLVRAGDKGTPLSRSTCDLV